MLVGKIYQLAREALAQSLALFQPRGKEGLKDQGYKWKTNIESCKVKNTKGRKPQGNRIRFQFLKKKKIHQKPYNLSCKLIPHLIFEILSSFCRVGPIPGKWNAVGEWQGLPGWVPLFSPFPFICRFCLALSLVTALKDLSFLPKASSFINQLSTQSKRMELASDRCW